jgi:hypothetical protein
MSYTPHAEDVQAFIDDFARDFCVAMLREDAERILTLYEELYALFEQYSEGDPIPPHLILP